MATKHICNRMPGRHDCTLKSVSSFTIFLVDVIGSVLFNVMDSIIVYSKNSLILIVVVAFVTVVNGDGGGGGCGGSGGGSVGRS